MEIFQSAHEKPLCQDYDLFRAKIFSFFNKWEKNMVMFSGEKKKTTKTKNTPQQNHSYCNSILLLLLFEHVFRSTESAGKE